MPRLIWTQPALRDLNRLHEFLAAHDRKIANRAVEAIRLGVKPLKSYPRLGRLLEDADNEARQWYVGFGQSGYVIPHQVELTAIYIIGVRHSREEEHHPPTSN